MFCSGFWFGCSTGVKCLFRNLGSPNLYTQRTDGGKGFWKTRFCGQTFPFNWSLFSLSCSLGWFMPAVLIFSWYLHQRQISQTEWKGETLSTLPEVKQQRKTRIFLILGSHGNTTHFLLLSEDYSIKNLALSFTFFLYL